MSKGIHETLTDDSANSLRVAVESEGFVDFQVNVVHEYWTWFLRCGFVNVLLHPNG